MKNWKEYWSTFPLTVPEEQFLLQVGKTVNKKPISETALEEIAQTIVASLHMSLEDDVLDLCCGNGIITNKVSAYCHSITGVDFAPRLLEVACRHHAGKNIEYFFGDIADVASILNGRTFNCAYMYEALQHFTREQFEVLLTAMQGLLKPHFRLFFGSVPDKKNKWRFYNSYRRKLSYIWRSLRGTEAIGTWWSRDDIVSLCARHGLKVIFMEQSTTLHTSHYRFDMYIYDAE